MQFKVVVVILSVLVATVHQVNAEKVTTTQAPVTSGKYENPKEDRGKTTKVTTTEASTTSGKYENPKEDRAKTIKVTTTEASVTSGGYENPKKDRPKTIKEKIAELTKEINDRIGDGGDLLNHLIDLLEQQRAGQQRPTFNRPSFWFIPGKAGRIVNSKTGPSRVGSVFIGEDGDDMVNSYQSGITLNGGGYSNVISYVSGENNQGYIEPRGRGNKFDLGNPFEPNFGMKLKNNIFRRMGLRV